MQITVVLLLMALVAGVPRTAARQDDAWAAYRFLIGTWTGEGQGQPGDTSGTATFRLDLDGRILVRTNRVSVPASGQQPASVHQDLMILYRDLPGQPVRAVYWDNEDHTIEYDVTASTDGKIVTFVSRPTASAPRFRLVYTRLDASKVDVKFEMAPPGSPDAFKVYTQGVTRKTGG
jgi:hypothetical protein